MFDISLCENSINQSINHQLASSPPLYGRVPRVIPSATNTWANVGSRLFSKLFSVRRVVVERADAHGLVRGGVGGNHRAIQGAVINVRYSTDEYICAACVTAHAVCMLTCELVSTTCRSSWRNRLHRLHHKKQNKTSVVTSSHLDEISFYSTLALNFTRSSRRFFVLSLQCCSGCCSGCKMQSQCNREQMHGFRHVDNHRSDTQHK